MFLFAGSAGAAQLTVRVLAQESIPPKWITDNGKVAGVCPDVLAAIERVEHRIRFTGFERGRSLLVIEDGLASGKVDVGCSMLDSPERRNAALKLQTPVYNVKMRLAAAAGDTQDVNSLDELARLKPLVNAARGSAFIKDLASRGIPMDETTGDNVVNLRKTLAGHGRYTYMNELSLVHLIRAHHLEGKLRILPAVFNEDPLYFWVSRKADPALAPMLDEALARLKASGELARIYARWSRMK